MITGGAGFIGSHLVDRLLAQDTDVRVLDSLDPQVHRGGVAHLDPAAELVQADVRDPDAVRRSLEGVDRVVHLAAAVGVGQSMYEITRYTSVNALGAAVVLEEAIGARDRLEKVVVAASMSIYGEGLYRCPAEAREIVPQPRSDEQLERRDWEVRCPSCGAELEALPTPEGKPLAPSSIYAVGKRDHEEMFLSVGRAYRVPVTALRFFNVFGPRQSLSNPYTGVAAIFASRLLNGRRPGIFEDGGQSRDFVHVDDIVRGILLALEPEAAVSQAVNLGAGRPVTVLEVANVLGEALGTDLEAEIIGRFRAGDIRHCYADISLARSVLGYEPQITFAEGMRELAGWLATEEAEDLSDEATAALEGRGLTV